MRLRIRRSPEALREVPSDLAVSVRPSLGRILKGSLPAKGTFYAGPVQRISGRGSPKARSFASAGALWRVSGQQFRKIAVAGSSAAVFFGSVRVDMST